MEELLLDLKSSWKAPSAKIYGDRLLDKCYEKTYKAVLTVIKGNPEGINISTNKSTTAIKERVMNFSILCKLGSFCMKQATVPTSVFGAEKQADWLELIIKKLERRYKVEFG